MHILILKLSTQKLDAEATTSFQIKKMIDQVPFFNNLINTTINEFTKMTISYIGEWIENKTGLTPSRILNSLTDN